jgi:hypothetical protein
MFTACGDEDSDPGTNDTISAADSATSGDVVADTGTGQTEGPISGGPECNFDEEMAGMNVGDHIRNLGAKTWDDVTIWLHQYCGYPDEPRELVWIVLGTGWCGACEGWAPGLNEVYLQYRDKGLQALWFLGETETHDEAPSAEWCENWVEQKAVDYPVVRDYKFYKVYNKIAPYSTGLPHQYLLDANTMELIYAQGGAGPKIKDMAICILDGGTIEDCTPVDE